MKVILTVCHRFQLLPPPCFQVALPRVLHKAPPLPDLDLMSSPCMRLDMTVDGNIREEA
jgi:hypothetical protein